MVMIRKDRAGSQKGGGLLAYINENLKADRIESLEHYALETLWLQKDTHKSKRPILVRELFTVRLLRPWVLIPRWNLILRQPILESKRCIYLRGEFNINYLDTATYQNQELKLKSSHHFSNTNKEFHMLKSFIYY